MSQKLCSTKQKYYPSRNTTYYSFVFFNMTNTVFCHAFRKSVQFTTVVELVCDFIIFLEIFFFQEFCKNTKIPSTTYI